MLLTDDRRIHELNHRYRGKDKPTDVLAFELDGSEAPGDGAPNLGDVVISLDTAARQAKAKRRTLLHEVRLLLAHGLLHLLGYDHARPAQKRRMNAMTRRLIAAATREKVRKRANRVNDGDSHPLDLRLGLRLSLEGFARKPMICAHKPGSSTGPVTEAAGLPASGRS